MADDKKTETQNPYSPSGTDREGITNPEPITTGPEKPLEGEEPSALEESRGFWQEVWHDKKLVYSTLGVVAFVLLAAGLTYFYIFNRSTPPPAPDVLLDIRKPSRIVANQPFDLQVSYSNRSDKTLRDVKLSFIYPQGFTFRNSSPESVDTGGKNFNLSDIGAGGQNNVEITGMLDGQIGDRREIKVQLRYKIANLPTTYLNEGTAELVLGAPDLIMTLVGPSEATIGQEVLYNISYQNISEKVLRDITASLTLPSEFKVVDAAPALSADNTWLIGDLEPKAQGGMRLRGRFQEATAIQRIIEIEAQEGETGLLIGRAFTITEVKEAPIFIDQSSDPDKDFASPGDKLTYRITLENRGSTTLTNLILSTDLTGTAYDLSSLDTEGGILAGSTITWAPGGVTDLKILRPGASTNVSFSLNIKDPLPSVGERFLSVASTPKVTSFELKEAVVGPEVATKIKAPISFTQDVAYESGAWPMKVGQETRFRVTWRLTNGATNLTDTEVTGGLPLGSSSFVRAENTSGTSVSVLPGDQIRWLLGNVEPNVQKQAALIMTYTPSVADTGNAPTLIRNISFKSRDTFINKTTITVVPDAKVKETVQ